MDAVGRHAARHIVRREDHDPAVHPGRLVPPPPRSKPDRVTVCESCSDAFGWTVRFPATLTGAFAHAESHLHAAALASALPHTHALFG